ncbi:c-type cytochrome [Rosistilla oblonga]|uniref:DUF7133 domain-containing protein n=1 Tax=Rosistilla oblonga TaxID=2527990 RepID=UPI003A978C77
MIRTLPTLVCIFCCCASSFGQPSPPPADQQRERFRLPPGFEIQLVVSDPEIGQPMNLNFDARGRLWVTHSVEYPYPAAGEGVQPDRGKFTGGGDHPPRDRLSIVEIGPTGNASQVTHFVDGLNIPIGQTPLKDGSEGLVYGIPSIFHVADRDGDGRSDTQTALYSRFGNIDVHGNANAFTRWIDGWIYGCHGFSNHSEISDAAGRTVVMDSGNTYRYRSDGSHFQQFTWGQVNPFGITFDAWGNIFDSDCHSKPVYQLLRGATYPHFGNPEPAIGFGPSMIAHAHGSTGICGPAYYSADHFPEEFRDNLFICNPVTGRVHRDKLRRVGSTLLCDTQPDFITTDDPWFRPVDAILGPDGALYIADFCNLVIGHYEAPLDDPDRDRTHGRVWRVVWNGEPSAPPQSIDLTKLSTADLIVRLSDPNLQVRTLATNYLIDSRADEVLDPLLATLASESNPFTRVHGLWILERLDAMDSEAIERFANDSDPLVRVHLLKMLAERENLLESERQLAVVRLRDRDAFIRRAAADALGQHPTFANIAPLLNAWDAAPAEDSHLIHVLRLTLQRHLETGALPQAPGTASFSIQQLTAEQQRRLLQVASVSGGDRAAEIVFELADPQKVDPAVLVRSALQITRTASVASQLRLVELAPQWFATDPGQQLSLLSAIFDGATQRGGEFTELKRQLRQWLQRLAPARLQTLQAGGSDWSRQPVPGLEASDSPWGIRHRGSADGNTDAGFWDSIAHGEHLTGVLRSPSFPLPATFSFWLCGHNGHPKKESSDANHIRLVLVDSGKTIAQQVPPRNDTAQRYTWTIDPDRIGQQAAIEIVDADRGNAYAWIAAGRFEPPMVRVSEEPQESRLIELIGSLNLSQFADTIDSLISDRRQSIDVRQQAIRTSIRLGRTERSFAIVSDLLSDPSQPPTLRMQAAAALAGFDSDASRDRLVAAIAQSPASLLREIASGLARTTVGIDRLFAAITAGNASARLLQEPAIIDSLHRNANEKQRQQIDELIQGLPPANEKLAEQLAHHRALAHRSSTAGSAAAGRIVFDKNCAACHRIASSGQLVGPQLDGVGNRGADRLLEDILDPNRNVDVAFRSLTVVTIDGTVVNGLLRRQEGETIVLADSTGREITISTDDIETQQKSTVSVMPGNFAESLAEQEIQNLLAFLLEQRAKKESPAGRPASP